MYMGIELIQIVRCKDCQWYVEDEFFGRNSRRCIHECTEQHVDHDDFFCAYAIPRLEEDE